MLTNIFLIENLWIKSFICLSFSYVIGYFMTKKYINFMHKKNLFQPIRSDGPAEHLKTKKKTPTMGGIFIVLATIITTSLFVDLSNQYILVAITITFSFAIIGLIDDLYKVILKDPNGLKGSFKIIIQFLLIGLTFLWLSFINLDHGNGNIFFPIGSHFNLNLALPLYIIFVTFVIVGSSNAVNLTDGLDGLVSVPAIINLICLISLIFISSNPELSSKYNVPFIKNSEELIFFCIAFIGSILAFLTFNLKPAKIFMGDVGSLPIGAVLGLIAIIIKQEFIFFIISLLFVIEALSVIIQVGSYKIRKKRVFLMAPIHHHVEKLGWSEIKVVKTFWFSALIFAIFGMSIFIF